MGVGNSPFSVMKTIPLDHYEYNNMHKR